MWQPQSHREHFFGISVSIKNLIRGCFFFLPSYKIWAHLFQTLPGDPLVGISKVHCFHFSVWTFLAAHKSLCHSDFVLRCLWVVMCPEMTMLEVERNWKSCEGQQFFSWLHAQAKLFKISPAWSHFKVSHYFKKTPLPSMIQTNDCSRLTANHHLARLINLVRGLTILPNNPKKTTKSIKCVLCSSCRSSSHSCKLLQHRVGCSLDCENALKHLWMWISGLYMKKFIDQLVKTCQFFNWWE